jgi:asparagine synthetase B (glutamine-hydrolysing)
VTEEEIIRERYSFIKEFSDMSIYDIWSLYSLFGDEDVTLSILSKIGEGNKRIIYFPFYDLNLLNYVFSIPWSLKLRKHNILAKELARQSKLPDFIINRPKSSFGIHSRQWSIKGGAFEALVPLASKVFEEKEIRKMQSYDLKKAMTFWNILNYSIWKRLCINNEPLEFLLEELG